MSPDEPVPAQIHHKYIMTDLRKRVAALRAFLRAEYKRHLRHGTPFHALVTLQFGCASVCVAVWCNDNSGVFVRCQVFIDERRPAMAIVDILNNDFTELTYNETAGSHLASRPAYWHDYVIRLSEEQDIDTRAKIMGEFKQQENYVLVTDDMAARGLDVPTLTHVVHFDVPQDPLVYLHRSGRTGRVGRDGTVLTLLSPEEEFVAKKLMNSLNIEMTPHLPNSDAGSEKTKKKKKKTQVAVTSKTRTEMESS